MRVREKLKFLVIISFIAIIILISATAYNEFLYRVKLYKIDNFLEFSKQSANLLHELQKERSISIIYLGSDGKILGDIISKQVKNTDEKLEKYKNFVNNSSFIKVDSLYEKQLKEIASIVSEINIVREQIVKKDLKEEEVYKYYNDLNFYLLSTITLNGKFTPISKITSEHISYGFLLKAKETASIKRAFISSSFIKKEINNEEIRKIVSLLAEENTYKNIFVNSSDRQIEAVYKRELETALMKEGKKLVFYALKSATEGELEVDVEKWFHIVAKSVEAYKSVDDFTMEYLEKQNYPTLTIYFYTIIVGLIFLVILFILTLLLSKDIQKRVHAHDWVID